MSAPSPKSLVSVYSTPLAFDAELVKAMLKSENIPGFVEETNAPFAGLTSIPCHVLVEIEHESRARELIEEHEAKGRQRMELEAQQSEDGVHVEDEQEDT